MKRKPKPKAKPRSSVPTCTITVNNWNGRQMKWRGQPIHIDVQHPMDLVRDSWSFTDRMIPNHLPTEIKVTFALGTEKCRVTAVTS